MKKYLVILAGSPRGGTLAWKSLNKYVLNYLDADLAVCYGSKFSNYETKYLENLAKFKWIFDEPDNWREYYDKNFVGNWEELFLLGEDLGLSGIDNKNGSGAIVCGLKHFILSNYSHEILEYEIIIYTRFDQMYTDYPFKFNEDHLYIPEGEDYGGICDRFIAMPSKYIKSYLNICNYINEPSSLEGELFNCEGLHLSYLKNQNLYSKVLRIPRFQFTVSTENDKTRWRVGLYKLHFTKLKLKYPEEFIMAFNTVIKNKSLAYIFLNKKIQLANYSYLLLRRKFGRFKKSFTGV